MNVPETCASAAGALARVVTGVRGEWRGAAQDSRPRIYFANHRSHADVLLIWAALSATVRRTMRAVGGADYWLSGRVRRFVARKVFRAVLIDRQPATRRRDPIAVMLNALDGRESLILFPEGTRNTTDEPLLPFKCGLYHVALARPDVEFVPVWIDNVDRVLPKGRFVPVPLLCTVTFGAPVTLQPDEDKFAFLDRCRRALLGIGTAGRS